MKHKVKRIIKDSVFYRETNRIIHDKNIFLLVLIAPILYVFFYGSVYMHNTVRTLNIGIVDNDHSSISTLIKQYCHADPMLISEEYQSLESVKQDFFKQKICAYLVIPYNFEKNLKRGSKSSYALYVSTAGFMQANEVTKHLLQINGTLSAQIEAKYLLAKSYSKKQALKTIIPIKMDINSLGNAVYGYGNFVLIGLFILILHQLLLIGLSESIAREREDGTLYDWYLHSGCNHFKMLSGKITPYLIFFMTYYIFYFTIPLSIFHLHQKANFIELILLAVPFFLVISELALLIGSFFKEKLQALQVLALTSVPFFLACGYAWPFFSLNIFLKIFSYSIPTYFMMSSFQSMTQLGSHLSDQWFNWMCLWIQVLFYGILVKYRYKYLLKKAQ